jgi:serine/threonine protein kinase, bacterial
VDTSDPPPRGWWRRKAIVIPGDLLAVTIIAAAVVVTGQRHENSNGPQTTAPIGTQHREPAYGSQVTLPFTGLGLPWGVAMDAAGDLYVADFGNGRVVKLAAG